MPDAPRFYVRPPLRCCHPRNGAAAAVCARPAQWERSPNGARASLFLCDEHRALGDRPIAGQTRFVRVSLVVEVYFAACHLNSSSAQSEALDSLERAVDQAGGLLSIVSATSVAGCYEPPAPRRMPAGVSARG